MTGLYVDPDDLRAKAAQIKSLQFTQMVDRPYPAPPDILPSTITAIANLDANSAALHRYQDAGHLEGIRLAETLNSVASAYEEVDAAAEAHIAGRAGPPEPVVPHANTIPDPAAPQPMGPPQVVETKFSLIEDTERMLNQGDGGASLDRAWETWVKTGTDLRASAQKMYEPIRTWEGDAAQQAYDKFRKFADWMMELATAWDQLAGTAFELADAHKKAKLAHHEIYKQYKEYEADRNAAAAGGAAHHEIDAYNNAMAMRQQDSDDLRQQYANYEQRPVVHAPDPPQSNVPTAPVTGNGVKPAGNGGAQGGGGGGAGSGGGGAPTDPSTAQTSPMSADPSEQSKGAQAGEQSGGGSGGGSPSGGEKGGGSGEGVPGLPSGDESTALPDSMDPRLSPAADAGGGAGSGGGGGGGAGPTPLQPSVNGVAVGPSPPAGTGSGGAAGPAAASAGGMMGGGMGGMAPMGGHGPQGGSTERKRTPSLSPDEELYTEDRPHTEGIIGRPERRAGQGKRDST